jgi:hypothetical protein
MAKKISFPNRPCPKCGKPIHIKSKKHGECGWSADANPTKSTSTNGQAETTSGYFRKFFKENPKLLKERSNAVVLEKWLADHPGPKGVPETVKQSLSNIKSILRSKRRKKVAKRAQAALPVGAMPQPPVARKPTGSGKLEALELQIDESLILARQLDREGLDDVIGLLRRARNAVVWKIGQ